MTAFASLSDVIAAATAATAEQIFFFKDGRVAGAVAAAPIAGKFVSLWQYQGFPMGAGAAPGGTARNPDRTTSGAIQFTNPAGGTQKWLLSASCFSNVVSGIFLCDRLADISGLSGTVTTAQNTTSLAPTRNTGGVGNEIWIEIFTQIGASSTTVTASYTNQTGVSGRTTQSTAIGNTGFREAQRMLPLSLQAGDTGVQSVQSITVLATTGTAGDIGVVILKPLCSLPMALIGAGNLRDFVAGQPPMPEVLSGACIFPVMMANTTTVPVIFGHIGMAEK